MKYRLIADKFIGDILSGVYKPGHILPPLNEFAEKYIATPSTIAKAIGILKKEGYIILADRQQVRYRVAPTEKIQEFRNVRMCECAVFYINSAQKLGYSQNEAIEYLINQNKNAEETK
jgi:DNA-binding transcriptional regulator YhcF (GntR family)